MPNILVTARYFSVDPAPLGLLRDQGCSIKHGHIDWTPGDAHVSPERAIELLADVDGAIVSSLPLGARVLDETPSLRVISIRGVGYDSVDIEAATARGIPVAVAPGFTESVADYVFGLMLAVSRQVARADRMLRNELWDVVVSANIFRKTLGIVGLGRIGKAVARRARGFEMPVLATDPIEDPSFAQQYNVSYVPFEVLLRRADIVSINAPLNEASRHLIDEHALSLMKSTAYLVNTARGDLVDENALAVALRDGVIAGAALDVFQHEPLKSNPFHGLDNVVLSPHLAAYSRDGLRDTGTMAARAVLTVLQGGALSPDLLANPSVYDSPDISPASDASVTD